MRQCNDCDGKGRHIDMSLPGWPSVECSTCGGTGGRVGSGAPAAASEAGPANTWGSFRQHKLRGPEAFFDQVLSGPLDVYVSTGPGRHSYYHLGSEVTAVSALRATVEALDAAGFSAREWLVTGWKNHHYRLRVELQEKT